MDDIFSLEFILLLFVVSKKTLINLMAGSSAGSCLGKLVPKRRVFSYVSDLNRDVNSGVEYKG